MRLGRIGFDNVIGFLDGSVASLRQFAVQAPLTSIPRVKVEAFRDHRAARPVRSGYYDVHQRGAGHIGVAPQMGQSCGGSDQRVHAGRGGRDGVRGVGTPLRCGAS